MLATLYGLEHLPIYNPLELDWPNLPERAAVMTHWRRSEPLISLLDEHAFRVVTLVRHPLDLLISILHYAKIHPETGRWMDGEGGDESGLLGSTPGDPAFLRYATGRRAKVLLASSHEWWQAAGVICIRYEDLVADTAGALERVVEQVGVAPLIPVGEVVEAHTLEHLRKKEGAHHWQGRPGLWRSLLTPRVARRIAEAHADLFEDYGYSCDPDEALDDDRAGAVWHALALR